jgi:hypothetical protein
VADALAALRARGALLRVDSKEWTFFVDPKSGAGWRFTLPGNPFHPSAIKSINCETRVLCEAGKNACDQLNAEERRSDERSAPSCRLVLEAATRVSVTPSPRDNPPVKADAVVTFNGPAKSCEITVVGGLPHSMPCPAVASYLTQTLRLPRGAYVDEETIPDVDVREHDRVMAALKDAGYRPTPGAHVGLLTEPSH